MPMSLKSLLTKRAEQILQEKAAFQPMPGGQPPADPNAQGGTPADPSMMGGAPGAGGAPMDPSMMGGAPGGAPMDPSMMGGAPGGMPPMDPSMMGMPPGMAMGGPPPATVGQLSVTDFQTIMTDMLSGVLSQLMGGGAAPADAGVPPPEVAPQGDKRTVSNTEINEKLDAVMQMLSSMGIGGDAGGGAALTPSGPASLGGSAGAAPASGAEAMAQPAGPDMGFGGQPAGGMPVAPASQAGAPSGGMEIQAGVRPSKRNMLADIILKKTAQARKA